MNPDIDDIVTLIGKDLSGEISQEEKATLEKWISQSSDNKAYYDQVKVLFDRTSNLKHWKQFDTDAAWVKVKAKIKSKHGKQVALQPVKTFLRMAASMLLFISVGYFAYQFFKPQDAVTVASGKVTVRKTLPDGTQISLNKNSSIQYKYNPVEKKRKVNLEGEAYFQIAEKKEEQFVLEIGKVIIEDIGTTFNVRAYPGSPCIEVYVETGEVAFYTAENSGIHLKENETGLYHKASNAFSKLNESDENVLAYKTGVFVFRDTPMCTVMETLNEAYETKLRLENKEVENCRITVSFKNESIDVIADVIAETLKLAIEKTENEIVFKGNECVK